MAKGVPSLSKLVVHLRLPTPNQRGVRIWQVNREHKGIIGDLCQQRLLLGQSLFGKVRISPFPKIPARVLGTHTHSSHFSVELVLFPQPGIGSQGSCWRKNAFSFSGCCVEQHAQPQWDRCHRASWKQLPQQNTWGCLFNESDHFLHLHSSSAPTFCYNWVTDCVVLHLERLQSLKGDCPATLSSFFPFLQPPVSESSSWFCPGGK